MRVHSMFVLPVREQSEEGIVRAHTRELSCATNYWKALLISDM